MFGHVFAQVWNHFDAGGCPGQAVGIRVRLDNGVMGYIHLKNLSDKHVNDPEERVRLGQVIHCRIMKIDPEKFSIEATSKATDLNDSNNKWRYVVYVMSLWPSFDSSLEIIEWRRRYFTSLFLNPINPLRFTIFPNISGLIISILNHDGFVFSGPIKTRSTTSMRNKMITEFWK